MKIISYENISHLLNDWQPGPYFDVREFNFLDEFLQERGYKFDIALIDLGRLYNEFSEEMWCAGWEADAEGQFIEWLEENMKI